MKLTHFFWVQHSKSSALSVTCLFWFKPWTRVLVWSVKTQKNLLLCLHSGRSAWDKIYKFGRPYVQITSLQQKRVYTSLGSSCPQCVHQSWEEYQLCHGLWCTHVGQEEPKLVYTLFCCKPVKYIGQRLLERQCDGWMDVTKCIISLLHNAVRLHFN